MASVSLLATVCVLLGLVHASLGGVAGTFRRLGRQVDAPESLGCDWSECPELDCVDPAFDGDCCGTCPQGGTCWLGDHIIPSGQTVVKSSGTSSCPILCRCPQPHLYVVNGLNTHADCWLSCAPSIHLGREDIGKFYRGQNNNNNPLSW